jgi:hypothetical protein
MNIVHPPSVSWTSRRVDKGVGASGSAVGAAPPQPRTTHGDTAQSRNHTTHAKQTAAWGPVLLLAALGDRGLQGVGGGGSEGTPTYIVVFGWLC